MKSQKYFIVTVIVLLSLTILVTAQNHKIKVACIGNSITDGGHSSTAYPAQLAVKLGEHYEVENFGISGTTLLRNGDFPYWEEESFLLAKAFNPDIVIIKLGTNDSKPQNWAFKDEFITDYIDFINEFRQNGADPQIYVANCCPVFQDGYGITGSIITNEIIPMLVEIREAMNTFMIDFYNGMLEHGDLFPDGIHPNATGYGIMADIAKAAILNGPSGFIRYFNSKDEAIELGQSTKIYWETTAGSNVFFEGTAVGVIDSFEVSPAQATEYTLIAQGEVTDTNKITINYLAPGLIKSLKAKPTMVEQGAGESSEIFWTTTNGSTVSFDGDAVAQNGSKIVTPSVTTTYTLNSSGNATDTRTVTVHVLPAEQVNRALERPITSSTTKVGFEKESANDGDDNTFWHSAGEASEWIMIDLEKTIEINRVVIKWGVDFATQYVLHAIDSTGATKAIYNTSAGDGGTDDITGLSAAARYLRVLCIKNNGAGYAISEVEIYHTSGTSDIPDNESLPLQFSLEQNYPNPFNPSTTIEYTLPVETGHAPSLQHVTLKVFDVMGREAAIVVNERQSPGKHQVEFDGSGLASGVYFYKLIAGEFSATKKFVMLK
ncbi:MAG: GDSL-type esterase/lipase family protein [bacterium]